MTRPIAYDVTHVVSRLPVDAPTGIDKVDLAYASHFSRTPPDTLVHYGFRAPRFYPGAAIADLHSVASETRWIGAASGEDRAFQIVLQRLLGASVGVQPPEEPNRLPRGDRWRRRVVQVQWRLSPRRSVLPPGAVYLNVAQHAFEYQSFFSWLKARPDVVPTFLVHDLLPMDFPEYFKSGYRDLFRRRLETVLVHAKALITTSAAVADRIAVEFERCQRSVPPIHVEPLPSSLPFGEAVDGSDAALSKVPYFVMVGTIEPRKNHLLALNIWRRLAQTLDAPPKLLVVGNRGWENEQVFDVLDRSRIVKEHVLECSGLGDEALIRLIRNARALLMPSFAEGYGLPVVEALALGTPVIASDIPVFREITKGNAVFRHPIDGTGWLEEIQKLSDLDNAECIAARAGAAAFKAPGWDGYFGRISSFLAEL